MSYAAISNVRKWRILDLEKPAMFLKSPAISPIESPGISPTDRSLREELTYTTFISGATPGCRHPGTHEKRGTHDRRTPPNVTVYCFRISGTPPHFV